MNKLYLYSFIIIIFKDLFYIELLNYSYYVTDVAIDDYRIQYLIISYYYQKSKF